jgi:hypothetical protein
VHVEKKRQVQEGSTSMLMFGKLIDYFDSSQSGREDSGLGQWVVMTPKGETPTRIICGYNPCGNNRPNSGMVYHQQRQYLILKRGCLTFPRVKFREDQVEQLQR